jgi:peptidyl-prolyl cis-trans isomerase SurA
MRFSIQIIAFFVALSFVTQNVTAQNNVIDEIIWVVGDEAILRSEVEEARREMLRFGQRMEGDPLCFIPEQLAVQKLFLNQARIDSIEVSEAAVNRAAEARINDMIDQVGTIERLEQEFGQSLSTIRNNLRRSIRDGELVRGVQQKHFGNIRLTPSDIRRFYSSLSEEDLPFIPTTMEMQIVTIDPVVPIEETDIVRARLRDITDRVHSGEVTFQAMAIAHSLCPSGVRGGALGLEGRATFQPPFANVGFALTDPTRVSNIVETEDGFHIIQLIERRGEMANLRHILLRPSVPQESFDVALARLDSIRIGIMEERLTFDEAATFLSSDASTRNNRGIMVNSGRMVTMQGSHNFGTPRFGLDEINQDIARVVQNMDIGDISEPFIMRRDNGAQVTAIVKVTNRTEGHRATLARNYQIIRGLAEDARRDAMVSEWLQRTIERTYVRINPAWQNCEFQFDGWLR